MSTLVELGKDARLKYKAGIDKTANAIKVTLGAGGRNVVIQQNGLPHNTKDGVTVALAVNLSDPTEAMGSIMVKEVAAKTVVLAGDGTTTASVLFQAMVDECEKVRAKEHSPIEVKKGMTKAVEAVVAKIKMLATPVETEETLRQIARISANNNPEIGDLIAETYWKIGRDGVITIEESVTSDTSAVMTEGMKIGRGYMDPRFSTNSEEMKCYLEKPLILMMDKKIVNMNDIMPILEFCGSQKIPLLIFSDEIVGEAFATLMINKMKGTLQVCAVRAPEFGQLRDVIMEDLATLTGGSYISDNKGLAIDKMHLGHCDRVVVDKNSTVIIGGADTKDQVATRIQELEGQLKTATGHDATHLKTRIARLKGGIAVLKVGGLTESEMKEKKDRVEDAICATKASFEEGFVAGGGTTYIACLGAIHELGLVGDEGVGADIISNAIQRPFMQILDNGGIKSRDKILMSVADKGYGTGINMLTETECNLLEAGVIDPAKVVRVALENAASIAQLYLVTECVISEIPAK